MSSFCLGGKKSHRFQILRTLKFRTALIPNDIPPRIQNGNARQLGGGDGNPPVLL
jgi:hypothetical protein